MYHQNQLKIYIFLDKPDHNGLTISPSEQEFLDFPGLIKRLNAKHAMEHGGVFLKPPVAIPTLDLHHNDQTFVKPVDQEFSLETDGTYALKERIEDNSRKGSKKISTFRKNSTNLTETGCNPEMEGSFWPKMLPEENFPVLLCVALNGMDI